MTRHPMPWPLRGEPLTYRQMQYWLGRYPAVFSENANPGTAHHREPTWTDIERLRIMARLVAAGIRPDAAAAIARTGDAYHRLSPHVVIRVSP